MIDSKSSRALVSVQTNTNDALRGIVAGFPDQVGPWYVKIFLSEYIFRPVVKTISSELQHDTDVGAKPRFFTNTIRQAVSQVRLFHPHLPNLRVGKPIKI